MGKTLHLHVPPTYVGEGRVAMIPIHNPSSADVRVFTSIHGASQEDDSSNEIAGIPWESRMQHASLDSIGAYIPPKLQPQVLWASPPLSSEHVLDDENGHQPTGPFDAAATGVPSIVTSAAKDRNEIPGSGDTSTPIVHAPVVGAGLGGPDACFQTNELTWNRIRCRALCADPVNALKAAEGDASPELPHSRTCQGIEGEFSSLVAKNESGKHSIVGAIQLDMVACVLDTSMKTTTAISATVPSVCANAVQRCSELRARADLARVEAM